MKKVLENLKMQFEGNMRLFCDNKSTISIACNLVQCKKTKHSGIDGYFIKEKLNNRLIIIACISFEY